MQLVTTILWTDDDKFLGCVGKMFYSRIFRPTSTARLQVVSERKWRVQLGRYIVTEDDEVSGAGGIHLSFSKILNS